MKNGTTSVVNERVQCAIYSMSVGVGVVVVDDVYNDDVAE